MTINSLSNGGFPPIKIIKHFNYVFNSDSSDTD